MAVTPMRRRGSGALRRALACIIAWFVWPFTWMLSRLRAALLGDAADATLAGDAAAARALGAALSARHHPKSSPLLDLAGEEEDEGGGDDDSAYGRDDADASRRFNWIGQVRPHAGPRPPPRARRRRPAPAPPRRPAPAPLLARAPPHAPA